MERVKRELKKFSSKEKALFYPRFFKTGVGEYGHGDEFIGVTVPNCRVIAKKYACLGIGEVQKLLRSKVHEERLIALLILVIQLKRTDLMGKTKVYNFYLKNTRHINNWDLVDLSADKIVGEYLYQNPNCTTTFQGQAFKGTKILIQLAKSKNLWERRVSIIATYYFIKEGEFDETLKISGILLGDKEDLIHKAVGWMLREAGKRNVQILKKFLKTNYQKLPRTALRYAIERFPQALRKKYLRGDF